jgi:TonB family protein
MPSKKILILSVIISLLAHALLISATGLLDKRSARPKPETAITVNLKEAPEIQPETASNDTKKEVSPTPLPPPEEVAESDAAEQETISLDSADERFVPYLKKIKQKIENIWSYPSEAFAGKKEGISTVLFSLDSRGMLVESKIVESSGHEALDQGTINVINAAAPYAPFPPEITLSRLNIQATFQYRFLQ